MLNGTMLTGSGAEAMETEGSQQQQQQQQPEAEDRKRRAEAVAARKVWWRDDCPLSGGGFESPRRCRLYQCLICSASAYKIYIENFYFSKIRTVGIAFYSTLYRRYLFRFFS
jgi:hypothetical protein